MQVKMHIKLNLKRLYQSDVYAVQELLKIASVLQSAMNIHETPESDDRSDSHLILVDNKTTRQIAAELTKDGAKLFDLLQV